MRRGPLWSPALLAPPSRRMLRASAGAEGTRCNTDLPGVAVREHDDCSSPSVPDSALCRAVCPYPCRSLGEIGQMFLSRPASEIRGRRPFGPTSSVKATLDDSCHGATGACSRSSIFGGGSATFSWAMASRPPFLQPIVVVRRRVGDTSAMVLRRSPSGREATLAPPRPHPQTARPPR